MNQQTEHEVFKELMKQTPLKEIAANLDVSYAAVIRLNKSFSQAKIQGTLDKLMNIERTIIEHAAEDLDVDPSVAKELVAGMNGLDALSTALQSTANQINQQLRTLIPSCESPSELKIYSEILCEMQQAFLGKNSVNIQVNNNGGETNGKPRYNQFLGDAPGA